MRMKRMRMRRRMRRRMMIKIKSPPQRTTSPGQTPDRTMTTQECTDLYLHAVLRLRIVLD
jgi:hypothetical protein